MTNEHPRSKRPGSPLITAPRRSCSTRNRKSKRQPIGYRRFAQAAEAVRFAIEELPPEFLLGTRLKVE